MNRILKVATIAATASLCAFAAEEKQATRPRQGSGGQAVTQGGGSLISCPSQTPTDVTGHCQ